MNKSMNNEMNKMKGDLAGENNEMNNEMNNDPWNKKRTCMQQDEDHVFGGPADCLKKGRGDQLAT